MNLTIHSAAQPFLDHSGKWLMREEARHNDLLAGCHLLLSDEHPFHDPLFFATIDNDGEIVGCAVRYPPDRLLLTELPEAVIATLAETVHDVYERLPGLAGPEREATGFATQWQRRYGKPWKVRFNWRWHSADGIRWPTSRAPGVLRLAADSDSALAASWARAYARDIETDVDVGAFFERRIRTSSLYIWEDREPRSMVALSGRTPNGIRISGVYTPPEFRGRGYASMAVAAASQLALDRGKAFCVLFTDLSDPSASSIYRKLGYRPSWDAIGIDFSG